nr:MAG TPA: YopX protein [Caudoviricetes sp.]
MKIESIKFKAKRLDNGEWVKGDLVHSTSYVGISYPSDEFPDVPIVHRVDPSTVCQYTGLTDCEGNEIWEGDIIRSPHFVSVATVKWDDSLCGFKCSDVTGNINFSFTAINHCSEWSIVSNKFDRKEGEK